jgi:potassium voltage-gated channel Eag-related subfamily H protein 8
MERQGTRMVLLRLTSIIVRFSQYSAVILSMLIIFFIFISHWLACVWFVIGRYQDGGDDIGKNLHNTHTSYTKYSIDTTTPFF